MTQATAYRIADAAREQRWAAALIAARRGDSAAWETALAEIADLLRRVGLARMARMGLGAEEAEDALQETLIALHTKQATWEAGRPILPWIHAIARHKVLDVARRERRRRARSHARPIEEMADHLAAPPEPDPVMGHEAIRLVQALPARERGIVSAIGIEGASVAAAALRFRITETAVRVAFHRGLARLRCAARRADEERIAS